MRLLILDDVREDSELEQRALRQAGISFEALWVDNRAGFLEALNIFRPDLIISDYNLPDINGLTAIKLVRERSAELPILLVTGALDDEAAAEVVKAGAFDFVRKDRLARLPLAVEHALAAVQANRSRRQTERIEAIGGLTAGIAHDFNNLLQAIISNLELVDDVEVPSAAREYVDAAVRIAEHGADLTRKLLSFARMQFMQPTEIHLGGFLQEFRDLLSRSLDPRIQIDLVTEPSPAPVWADATYLQNALLNIAINARDAMPSGGKLRIDAFDNSAAAATGPADDHGRFAVIRISDTGSGIAPENLARVCEPFFSTKGLNGTGLGLAMVHGFAKQSGGELHIASEPGKGTSVSVWLPLASTARRSGKQPVSTHGQSIVPKRSSDT